MKLVIPNKPTFFTMDTGINIGIAVFSDDKNEPISTKLIQGKPNFDWEARLDFVIWYFEEHLKAANYPKKVYIEKPVFRETNRGLVSARSGSLYKLIEAYILEKHTLRRLNFEVIEISADKWKGQLDKKKVDVRIKILLNKDYQEHVSDAVGMGLWVKGLFKSENYLK